MVWKYDGRQIRVGRVWTDNDGTMHSGRWVNWDADTKEAKDRKSTRLNSSHLVISYAVFCLKKKKKKHSDRKRDAHV